MRKTILILCLSFPASTLLGQQDMLLRQFKFRDVNYRAVTFDLNGSSSINDADYFPGSSYGRSAGGYFSADYLFLKSTDKILLNGDLRLSTNYGGYKQRNNSTENKNHHSQFSPSVSVVNKWYSGQRFLELGADGRMSIVSVQDKSVNLPNTSKERQRDYFMTLTAGFGHGRLENVTSVQNALWLVEALQKENRLSQALSTEQLNGLSHAIVRANNTRVLDLRKKNQFMLETVDGYLQNNNLVGPTDIRYFSNLNDILFYAFNLQRLSGTEKYLRFTPGIALRKADYTQSLPGTNRIVRSESRSAQMAIGINRFKPVNRRHQNNYGASLYIRYHDNLATDKYFSGGLLMNDITFDPILHQAGATLFFEHAIYPNTRTIINCRLQTDGGVQKFDDESRKYGDVSFSAMASYFISYRTRLTGTVNAGYQSQVYRYDYYYYLVLQPDYIMLNATLGIQVSL